MKTVKILSGGYGLKTNGRTSLILKGQTCTVDDGEADYLAGIGAAVIVGPADTDKKAEAPKEPEVPEGGNQAEGEDDTAEDEEEEIELETMTNKQLEAICKEMGINTKTLTNKTKLINAIKAKQDEMPDLGAEEFE